MTTSTTWTRQDLRGTLRSADRWWQLLTEGLDDAVLHATPTPGAPSVAELRATDIAARAHLTVSDVTEDEAALGDATLARLSAAGRTVAALGHGAPHAEGTVAGLFVSDGGVPKLPLESAEVGPRGVVGDRQAARQHHGRVWQALCLWSGEVVDRLADEGHDIAPGRAGENVSVRGVEWSTIRPGTRVRLGDVLAEVSAVAEPCAKNKAWFAEGDFMRMAHDREPGVSRWYATVLEPGRIAVGDAAVVEP